METIKFNHRRRRKPGNIRWLMYILFVLLVSLSLFFFIQSSFFAVSSIEVIGNKSVSVEDVIKLSGLMRGENIFKVDLAGAEEKIHINSMIEEVSIERKLPRTIVIQIKERIPVALIPAAEGFLEIDINGYVLGKITNFEGNQLPIITGVNFLPTVALGTKLESSELQMGLKMVAQMDSRAKELVAEIDVFDPQQLKVYTIQGAEVRFGDASNFQEKFSRFLAILKEEEKNNRLNDIEYIDVSFSGKPVVFYRN